MNKETAVVVFSADNKRLSADLEVPLAITANDFIVALNTAYNLEIDTSNIRNCYLKAENPIALLKGNKTLYEFGIRNGSHIIFTERENKNEEQI